MNSKVVLLVLYDLQKMFLLQHRSKNARLLPGYWAFFGGGVEQGETHELAIHREIYEELNLKLKSPKLMLEQDFSEQDIVGHMYVYIDIFDGDKSALRLCEGQGMGWFRESELCNLRMLERDRQIIRTALQYIEDSVLR